MKKNQGFTLVEFVVSIALVAVVLIFLFNLLLDVQYATKNGNFASDNQLNRASILKNVMDDFSNLGLVGMKEGSSSTSHVEFTFLFRDGSEKTLRVEEKFVIYGDERWSVRSSNGNAIYQVQCINYQYVSPASSCQNDICSDYFSVHIRIPVTIKNQTDNTMDDLDLFYIGKVSEITENSFPHKSFLGYNSASCTH